MAKTYKFSDLKQALKQGQPASVINDIVANLSSGDINKAVQTLNPGLDVTLFNTLMLESLQRVAASLDPSTAARLSNLPPEFLAFAQPSYADTAADDTFAAATGTFQAVDLNNNALTYGLVGGSATLLTVDGATYNQVAFSAYGGLFLNTATGAWRFIPDNDAVNALTATTSADFTITTSDGTSTVSKGFTVTFNGTNDAVVVSGAVTTTATEDGVPATLDALANASDVDTGQTLSVVDVPADLPAGVTYNAAAHSFALDPTHAAYQHLAAGAQMTVTVNYGLSDGTATTAASVSWTVIGTNDAPVVSGAVTGAATEDGAASTLDARAHASDVDDGTTLSVVNLPANLPAVGCGLGNVPAVKSSTKNARRVA
jgi:VCBS repeat-containing protein